MLLIAIIFSLLLTTRGQRVEDDPGDMLNYDSSSKTMRKPAEIEEQKNKITQISLQPSCNPVFKRFLKRLLKEIQQLGLPSDSSDNFYDAKVMLSKQSMKDIQTFLEGEDSCSTGTLDNAISQILVDLRPHDYEAWKGRFEDTFGVVLNTVLKIGLCVLLFVAIICTELWSKVSRLMQIKRTLVLSFFVSIFWNWLYLYKIAVAEQQNNMAQMEYLREKCSGVKKTNWIDSVIDWYRSTWTLQDDPCQRYYEVVNVWPILLVTPLKAMVVTIMTFVKVLMGISDFCLPLLKYLLFTSQILISLVIVLITGVLIFVIVLAVFKYGITAPLWRREKDPPAPELEHPQPRLQRIEDRDPLAGGDAPQQAPRYLVDDGRLHRNEVRQRQPHRPMDEALQTLGTVDLNYTEDETDSDSDSDSDVAQHQIEPRSENQQDAQEGAAGESVAKEVQTKTKPDPSDSAQSKAKDNPSTDDAEPRSQSIERRPSLNDVEELGPSEAEYKTSSLTN